MRFLICFCIVCLGSVGITAAEIEELKGSLVIVGGGKMPDSIRDQFFELAGKEKAEIVVISTASIDADDPKKSDLFLKQWLDLKPKSAVILHTRDRKQADDSEFIKPLESATAVWFSGGDQKRILQSYLGTKTEAALRNVLNRGGVIGGSSAGAAIQSEITIEGGQQKALLGKGFGWLPGSIIDQHFLKRNRTDRLIGALENNPGYVGIGIDEATAVVVQKRSLKVIGDSYVLICQSGSKNKPASVQVLKNGEQADWFQLRRNAQARKEGNFPPTRPQPPKLDKGSLVIGGGGGLPQDVLQRFLDLAGGKDAPIVVVSTAYDDPVPKDPVECRLLRKAGATNVVTLHTRNRKEANQPEFYQPLKLAKGVWFSGGRQWRFVDSYEGTECEKLFREVLNRDGVIGGSSAGASIQAEYMPRGHPLGNTVMMAEGYEKGFGYLKGVAIDQHFFARKRMPDMSELVQTYPQLLGIGIDEGTAIIVQGSTMEVMGRSKVAIYDRRRKVQNGEPDFIEVPTGKKFDLIERKLKD